MWQYIAQNYEMICGFTMMGLAVWKAIDIIVAIRRAVTRMCRTGGKACKATGRGIGGLWLMIWRAFRNLAVRLARVWDARNNRMVRNQADSIQALTQKITELDPHDPRLAGLIASLANLTRAHAYAIQGNSPIP